MPGAPERLQAGPDAPDEPRPRRRPGSVIQDLTDRLRITLLGLLLLVSLHIEAMMAIEGMSLDEATWLTFTTITTTGYGDLAAKTPAGRAATIILIYLSGIFLLTQAATTFFELRILRRLRMRRGEWRWKLRDHIVFINAPAENPCPYLRRLLDQLHASHAGLTGIRSLLLTEDFPEALPLELVDDKRIVQVRGRFDDPDALSDAGVDEARFIVILAAQDADRLSDSRAFDLIHRLRERGAKARIVAECVEDSNRPRLRRAGADAVLRPLRAYPEMIVRAIVAPGAERIIERLFSSEGDECLRYEVSVDGLPWCQVAFAVLQANFGTPIAYVDAQGQLRTNPPPMEKVALRAIFVMVDDSQHPTSDAIQTVLDRAARSSVEVC
ncbi:ion channel [Muricoccus radiodurans]|uniref:ion channel n=1 Tax=Muricoccus radiodurans TaxID=2231721 RepID=UPI003CF266BC